MSKHLFRVLACAAALCSASGVHAQSKTWNFNDRVETSPGFASCTTSNAGGTAGGASGIGNVFACEQQPAATTTSLTVSAYSTTGSGSVFAAAAITDQGGNGFGAGNSVEGGTGATALNGSWDHSVDSNGNTDALLLNFTTGAEALTHVTVGWTGTDGDFAIWRWTGSGSAVTSLTGRTVSTLGATGSGWQLVSLVGAAGGIDTPDVAITGFNTANLTSSFWLLSAYNTGYTSAAGGTNVGSVTAGTDFIKFVGVGATTPGLPPQGGRIPEPASLALVAAALLGVGVTRRRGTPRAA